MPADDKNEGPRRDFPAIPKKCFVLKVFFLLLFMTTGIGHPLLAAPSPAIRVDQVGYLANETKLGMVASTAATGAFDVRRASDNVSVFNGTLAAAFTDSASGDSIRTADFSSLTTEGTYYLDVAGVGTSYSFDIGPNTFTNAYTMAMRAFYGQRCGIAVNMGTVDVTSYSHAICHASGAATDRPSTYHSSSGLTGTKNTAKGWHDAGDFGKYIVNSGISTGEVLWTFEWYSDRIGNINLSIPESGNSTPDILDEARWNLEWMLTMQDPSDGGVWHKNTSAGFGVEPGTWALPENDNAGTRYIIGTGSGSPYKTTCSTADFAAVMAIAARLYQAYDATFATTCLNAAVTAWGWLQVSGHNNVTYTQPTGITTGAYGDNTTTDERLWAAAELFRTTGAATYNSYVTINAPTGTLFSATTYPQEWGNVRNLALWTYYFATGGDSALKTRILNDTITAANTIATRTNGNTNGYRVSLTNTQYVWGSNGGVANYGIFLLAANRMSASTNYVNAALNNLHYILGRNTHNVSFVTHVGENPYLHPHHRPSGSTQYVNLPPWPGMLSGGPNSSSNDGSGLDDLPSSPPAKRWVDERASYASNEIAINWQAPLVFLLASTLPTASGGTPTFTRTRTFTPTRTPTPSVTPTSSATRTPTRTSTNTPSRTPTVTPSASATRTFSPTPTPTPTFTTTATRTTTGTPTSTRTLTPTATASATRTSTGSPTSTPTRTSTASPTRSSTSTPTRTSTSTASFTPVVTSTPTPTRTLTSAPTPTPTTTATRTSTGTSTASHTPTSTLSSTATVSATRSPTGTPTYSRTFTGTATPSRTSTSTPTPSRTSTSTVTLTRSMTPSATASPTSTPTSTPSRTASPTGTATPSRTLTPTITLSPTGTLYPTSTPTITPAATSTGTRTYTPTASTTATPTRSPTLTTSPSATPTSSTTPTATHTATVTPSFSATPSASPTVTLTPTVSTTPALSPTLTSSPSATPTFTRSMTASATSTGTVSATPTLSPTFTGTATPSRTNTPSPIATFTPSPTVTRTPSPTVSSTESMTPTATHTLTATLSPTPPILTVTIGAQSPPASTQPPGVSNLPVLQVLVTNSSGESITLTSLVLTASGSGMDSTGIESVRLWLDNDGDGTVGGGDDLLGSGVYGWDNGTATITLNRALSAYSSVSLLVAYDFYATASEGSYQTSLNAGGISGTSAYGSLQFSGLPVTGALVSIASPTATVTPSFTTTHTQSRTPTPSPSGTPVPTNTPTPSFTPTGTHTPPPTPTGTPTPSPSATGTFTETSTPLPSEVVISYPYPNPSRADQLVNVDLQLPGPSTLQWAVFTVAYRRINSGIVFLDASGTFQWDLKDKSGVPAASGLYYLRLEVNGDFGAVEKVFKILILK